MEVLKLARARQASSPAPEAPAPSPRPSPPEAPAPPPPVALETAAPASPAKDAPPPVAYGRLLANGALLLVLVFEGGVLVKSLTWMNKLTGAFALLAGVLALMQMIFNLVFQFVSEEFKARTRSLLQSPRLTQFLAVVALLAAGPSGAATLQILRPPPFLRILPGRGVFNLAAQAVKGAGGRYVLQVRQDGKILGTEEVTGAGSIDVGHDPEAQAESLDDSFKNKQKEDMDKYIKAPGFQEKWMDARVRQIVKAPLPRGCVQLELTYEAGTFREPIAQQWVRLDSKPTLIFLEENKVESHGCGS